MLSKGLLAGYCLESGEEVYLDHDHLIQHISICGSTGSGSSIIRQSLMEQQINNGGGLLILDGGLSNKKEVEAVYQNACSFGRESDFILIDLSNSENLSAYSPENLEKFIRENRIVYIKLPSFSTPVDKVTLAKSIVDDCRSILSRLHQASLEELPSKPCMFFANDCASYIDTSWGRIFEQGRSSRFVMIPEFQTINSLGETNSDIVMGNTYYKFFCKQVSMESAIEVAEHIGMKYMADGEMAYMVEPEKINSIPVGECFLRVGGDKMYHLRLANNN